MARKVVLAGGTLRRQLLLLPLAHLGKDERLHLARGRHHGAHHVAQPRLQLRVCAGRQPIARLVLLHPLDDCPPPLRALPLHLARARQYSYVSAPEPGIARANTHRETGNEVRGGNAARVTKRAQCQIPKGSNGGGGGGGQGPGASADWPWRDRTRRARRGP